MEKTQHTPGPWKVNGNIDWGRFCIDDEGGRPVATTEQRHGDHEFATNANARLIAAAPELLEALQAMFRTYNHGSNAVLNKARAAITKATGANAADATYEERVIELEQQGLTTSDAQAVADTEDYAAFVKAHGKSEG